MSKPDSKKLFNRAKELITELCGRDHPYEITLEDEDYFDPSIDIDGVAAVYWNEWTMVSTPKQQGYQLCSVEHNSGVRYYSDGSGEAPSCSTNDIGIPSEHFDEQILGALKLAMAKRLDEIHQGTRGLS